MCWRYFCYGRVLIGGVTVSRVLWLNRTIYASCSPQDPLPSPPALQASVGGAVDPPAATTPEGVRRVASLWVGRGDTPPLSRASPPKAGTQGVFPQCLSVFGTIPRPPPIHPFIHYRILTSPLDGNVPKNRPHRNPSTHLRPFGYVDISL